VTRIEPLDFVSKPGRRERTGRLFGGDAVFEVHSSDDYTRAAVRVRGGEADRVPRLCSKNADVASDVRLDTPDQNRERSVDHYLSPRLAKDEGAIQVDSRGRPLVAERSPA
jgi:hypothetical protein